MAETVTLVARDDDGERILDEFEEQTGLEPVERAARRVYEVEGEDHRVEVVETLTSIDVEWTSHIALEMPA